MVRPSVRVAFGALVAGSLFGIGVTLGGTASASPATDSETWSTPGDYDFVVPAGVTELTIEVAGAEGGDGEMGGDGGLGGYLAGDFDVTPGETLKVHVGGEGHDGVDGLTGGGENGGGAVVISACLSGGGGGGASDVRTADDALTDRIIVAGGGGGGGVIDPDADGGVGGGSSPTNGGTSYPSEGGYAGGATAGGAGGGNTYGASPNAGSLGLGGDASDAGCVSNGAGGGGHYGGGAGAMWMPETSGGGGGLAYIDPAATLTGAADGTSTGDGEIVITWVVPPPVTTTTTTTTTAPTTTTTTVPAPATTTTTAPAPAPAPTPCPSPMPPLRVQGNAFSLDVAKFLVDDCGAGARAVAAGGELFWVVDPPATSACPTWRAVRVVLSRPSLLIAQHLLEHCKYSVRLQMEGRNGAAYVVPTGYPAGRVTP